MIKHTIATTSITTAVEREQILRDAQKLVAYGKKRQWLGYRRAIKDESGKVVGQEWSPDPFKEEPTAEVTPRIDPFRPGWHKERLEAKKGVNVPAGV